VSQRTANVTKDAVPVLPTSISECITNTMILHMKCARLPVHIPPSDGNIHKYMPHAFEYIQGVPGGKDLTSGECSLGQTIPI